MFAALGTTPITIGLVMVAASVPLSLAGGVLMWSAKRRVHRRGDEARPAAAAAVARGQDLDAVANLLIATFKLPAVPAIKTLARAAGISVGEAKETVLRNLTPSRRRSLERIGPRLDRMLGDGSPT